MQMSSRKNGHEAIVRVPDLQLLDPCTSLDRIRYQLLGVCGVPKKEVPGLRNATISEGKGRRKYPHQACLVHLHAAASNHER